MVNRVDYSIGYVIKDSTMIAGNKGIMFIIDIFTKWNVCYDVEIFIFDVKNYRNELNNAIKQFIKEN